MDLHNFTNITLTGNQSLPKECLSNEMSFIYIIVVNELRNLFYTTGQTLLILVLCPIVAAFGFFGNTALLIVLVSVRDMHTITNFYLGNLAVSDLMELLLQTIRYLRVFYGTSGFVKAENIDRSLLCILDKAVPHVFFFASFGFVTLVSLERFYAVCYPIKYRNSNSRTRAIKYVTFTWILATITTVVITPTWWKVTKFCVVWEGNVSATVYSYCDAAGPAFSKLHALIEGVYCFVSMGMCVTSYIMIINRLRKRQIPGVSKKIELQAKNTRNQVTRMVVLNGLVYFLCQAPYQIYNLYIYSNNIDFTTNAENSFSWIGRLLHIINSSVNPIIYTAANSKYRQAFHQTFLRRCSNTQNRNKMRVISRACETRL